MQCQISASPLNPVYVTILALTYQYHIQFIALNLNKNGLWHKTTWTNSQSKVRYTTLHNECNP